MKYKIGDKGIVLYEKIEIEDIKEVDVNGKRELAYIDTWGRTHFDSDIIPSPIAKIKERIEKYKKDRIIDVETEQYDWTYLAIEEDKWLLGLLEGKD